MGWKGYEEGVPRRQVNEESTAEMERQAWRREQLPQHIELAGIVRTHQGSAYSDEWDVL